MRCALFWSPDGALPAFGNLNQCGWEIEPTSNPLVARSDERHTNVRVGVAAFDPTNASLSVIQDTVLATRPLEWIALIPPNSIKDTRTQRVIGETFYDYHTTPVQPALLAACLGHASGMAALRGGAQRETTQDSGRFSMVGRSAKMQRMYRAIERVAQTDAPVLIVGETGTGKELAARAIHLSSARGDGPFVPVNCSALPETLIRAELLGYEKGALPGAKRRRIGRIEAATGGTLFLDELGDLPLSVQAVLLRFLQEHTIERLGSIHPVLLDVRVLAATRLDLEALIDKNEFRADLYYRLNVLRIEVPPLREREGDVALLADAVLNRFIGETRSRARGFARSTMEYMNAYEWPGNVRELVNRVHRASLMSDGRLIALSDLGLERRKSTRGVLNLERSREQAERQTLLDALARFRTVTRAAAALGISRMTLYRLMAKYGLKRDAEPS